MRKHERKETIFKQEQEHVQRDQICSGKEMNTGNWKRKLSWSIWLLTTENRTWCFGIYWWMDEIHASLFHPLDISIFAWERHLLHLWLIVFYSDFVLQSNMMWQWPNVTKKRKNSNRRKLEDERKSIIVVWSHYFLVFHRVPTI